MEGPSPIIKGRVSNLLENIIKTRSQRGILEEKAPWSISVVLSQNTKVPTRVLPIHIQEHCERTLSKDRAVIMVHQVAGCLPELRRKLLDGEPWILWRFQGHRLMVLVLTQVIDTAELCECLTSAEMELSMTGEEFSANVKLFQANHLGNAVIGQTHVIPTCYQGEQGDNPIFLWPYPMFGPGCWANKTWVVGLAVYGYEMTNSNVQDRATVAVVQLVQAGEALVIVCNEELPKWAQQFRDFMILFVNIRTVWKEEHSRYAVRDGHTAARVIGDNSPDPRLQ